MSIIAVYSIKGGVGKTATAVNLAHLSSQSGPTLLCDLDPQGAASFYFRMRPQKNFHVKKLLKGGHHLEDNIRGSDYPGLDILPADFSYRHLDIDLDEKKKASQRLRKVLQPLSEQYNQIILDCPPNITLLSENIFNAADAVLIPLIPTPLSLRSLEQLEQFFDEEYQSQEKLRLFCSMVERRKKIHAEIMDRLQQHARMLRTCIPFAADVERMGIFRQPITAALPASAISKAYQQLLDELIASLP